MKLIENNPLNDTNNIKYVRHKDTKSDIFNGSFFDTSSLEIYQKQQETNVFKVLIILSLLLELRALNRSFGEFLKLRVNLF